MGILVKIKTDMFKEVEKLLKYRFWDKERERSNRATQIQGQARGTARRCPLRHNRIAWSGPPHDPIRAYICVDCGAAASEPEIKDRGFDFLTVPDWEMVAILDLDLERQSVLGNATQFYVPKGGNLG